MGRASIGQPGCIKLARFRKTSSGVKLYKSQIPVIEQALDTAALMLGTDKSRGYCLEIICADFLAAANLDNGNPDVLLNSISQFFKFLPGDQKRAFLQRVDEKIARESDLVKSAALATQRGKV